MRTDSLPDDDTLLTAADVNRLKWRCRRGLLENDLFIERFFRRHEAALTRGEANALLRLMELADNDLLDLLLGRREPDEALAPGLGRADIAALLARLRVPSGLAEASASA